jgi:hypothetical protein
MAVIHVNRNLTIDLKNHAPDLDTYKNKQNKATWEQYYDIMQLPLATPNQAKTEVNLKPFTQAQPSITLTKPPAGGGPQKYSIISWVWRK